MQRAVELGDAIRAHGAERILITGSSGCGKTALAYALAFLTDIGLSRVRCADALLKTHSVRWSVGAPTARERAQREVGTYVHYGWESALSAVLLDWLAMPGPWIIEGAPAMSAWASAMHRSGVPGGVDAAVLCVSPPRMPAQPQAWVTERNEILRLWDLYAPDVVFAGGLVCEWVPQPRRPSDAQALDLRVLQADEAVHP